MYLLEKFWHKTLKRPFKLKKTINSGKGEVVLLIHGLGTSGKTWKPLLKHVNRKKMHLIGYDLLGFGKSPKPEYSSYSVHEHARSLIASLDKTAKNQKIVIVGHSMGCLVASHIAWKKPGMVSRMVLYEPPLFADSPEFRSHKRRKQLYFTFYEQLLRRPKIFLAYSKAAAKFKFSQGRALSVNSASWTPFERSLKNTIMSQTAYDELKNLTVPTDIIYGKFDFVVTRADVKKMLEANPSIKFHLVNEMHDVTDRAGKYIAKLLQPA